MKKHLVTGIVLAGALGVTGTTRAADIRPAPPGPSLMTPVSVYDWSGLYLGINGGGLWNGVSAGLVGVTAGYNFQTGPWVIGVEGDVGWVTNGASVLGTVRGRLGYAFDRVLPYLTAGGAFTDGASSGVIGAGLEFAFNPALSFKGEYLYAGMNGGTHILRAGLNYRFLPGALAARY